MMHTIAFQNSLLHCCRLCVAGCAVGPDFQRPHARLSTATPRSPCPPGRLRSRSRAERLSASCGHGHSRPMVDAVSFEGAQ